MPQESEKKTQSRWEITYDSLLLAAVLLLVAVAAPKFSPLYGDAVTLLVAWIFLAIFVWRRLFAHQQRIAKGALIAVVGVVFYLGWSYMPRPEPKKLILTFKGSSFVTAAIERRLDRDFNGMRNYFEALGIKTNADVPPITIVKGSAGGYDEAGGLPQYRKSIRIGSDNLSSVEDCTGAYADYAVDQLFNASPRLTRIMEGQPPDQEHILKLIEQVYVARELSTYFNHSFWGEIDDKKQVIRKSVLWEIHEKLGADFTDRLAAAVLNTTVDTPDEGSDPNFLIYFSRKIKIGYSIVESGQEKWSTIVEILKENGLPVD
jgi:hypothetical protein